MRINPAAAVFAVACSGGSMIVGKTTGHENLVYGIVLGSSLTVWTYCKIYGRNPDRAIELARKIYEFSSRNFSSIVCIIIGFGLPSLFSRHFSWPTHIVSAIISFACLPFLAGKLFSNQAPPNRITPIVLPPPMLPVAPRPIASVPAVSLSPEVEGQTQPSAPPSPVTSLPLSRTQHQPEGVREGIEGQMKWQDEDQPGALPSSRAISPQK